MILSGLNCRTLSLQGLFGDHEGTAGQYVLVTGQLDQLEWLRDALADIRIIRPVDGAAEYSGPSSFINIDWNDVYGQQQTARCGNDM